MKSIILVRHAVKEHDIPNGDPILTKIGQHQANEIAEYLNEKYDFEVVLSSVLLRAQQTAEAIANRSNVQMHSTLSFNEYFLRKNGKGVETTQMLESRAMVKLYSIFDMFDSIVLVAHSSMLSTVIRNLLNTDYETANNLFDKYGEVNVLRYDWKKGDDKWQLIDTFIPKQQA